MGCDGSSPSTARTFSAAAALVMPSAAISSHAVQPRENVTPLRSIRSPRGSVGDGDDSAGGVEEFDGALSGAVDLYTGLSGDAVLVVGAGAVELPVAEDDPAFGEDRRLQLPDGAGVRTIGKLPGHGLGEDLRGTARACRVDDVLVALGADASVELTELGDLVHIVGQVGQLV